MTTSVRSRKQRVVATALVLGVSTVVFVPWSMQAQAQDKPNLTLQQEVKEEIQQFDPEMKRRAQSIKRSKTISDANLAFVLRKYQDVSLTPEQRVGNVSVLHFVHSLTGSQKTILKKALLTVLASHDEASDMEGMVKAFALDFISLRAPGLAGYEASIKPLLSDPRFRVREGAKEALGMIHQSRLRTAKEEFLASRRGLTPAEMQKLKAESDKVKALPISEKEKFVQSTKIFNRYFSLANQSQKE